MARHFSNSFCLISLFCLIVGCGKAEMPTIVPDAGLHPDWISEAPDLHGFDVDALTELRAYAMAPDRHTNSVLIVRHGVLVAEWYTDDRGPNDFVTSWSSAKSIAATLVAIAVAAGAIPSLDEPMTTYIPEWLGSAHESITLRHVLNMASGLAWSEAAGLASDLTLMSFSSDQLEYVLGQTIEAEPGMVWNYSSGSTMLLSRVIESATGMEAEAYMRKKLVEPLQFARYEWWRDGGGHTLTYCCIDATPRDFAKIGQLFLQDGIWGGQQVVPKSWIDAVWRDDSPNPSYALHFWRNRPGGNPDRPTLPRSLVYAQGHDGQHIFMFPEQNLLVVRHARFVRPEGEAVAPDGILNAGMFLEGAGPTGTRGPAGSDWDITTFLELVLAALAS